MRGGLKHLGQYCVCGAYCGQFRDLPSDMPLRLVARQYTLLVDLYST